MTFSVRQAWRRNITAPLVRLDFQQEDGFVSALPLGVNRIKIQRGLTTSAVAVFVPFTTQEIFHGGEASTTGSMPLPAI